MDKVAIVTGAGGALGSAISRHLGTRGYGVVVNYYRNKEGAEKIAQEITSKGPGQGMACKADIRSFAEVQAMVDTAVKKFGRLDLMVCNAGGSLGMINRSGKEKLLLEHDEAEWDLVIETNMKGAFNLIKACAPVMIKQKNGHITVISSGTGLRGTLKMASYAAAKAGEIGLMKAAARELGEHNIKVNAICPGRIMHGVVAAVVSNFADDAYLRETLLHKNGDAEELAKFIGHLATMENVSGQTLNLDSRILF
ncbi:MAG: SDR family oxidoreductase [Chloroflexi bacterium]|nr:SDR family oxidoreductase [Chloroflexota bacterium]